MENKEMDLDNIKSNLLALRQLYGLLRNDRDGLSKLTSDGLDYEARVMLKNLLDTTTNDVLKAHSEIIARQACVHSLPQPLYLVDTAKQRSLALSDLSKTSAVIQSRGEEPVVMDSTFPKEKQECIMPITQTAYAQPPQFSFSASESGNKRKFCRICKRPKFEKPFIPCIKIESSEKEAPHSTKVVALQEQQNSLFANFSWDTQQEALQSGNAESAKAKTVDVSQSMHELPGVVRSVPDGDHDLFSTETNDVIKQLESHISALQMDDENLVLSDKHATEHKFKPITVFMPQAELATPIKKIEGDTSSLCSGYVVPPTRMSKFPADQLPKLLESSSYQPNQLRQQKIVANTFPSEEHDTSKMLDLVEENQWQIQKEHSINVQSKNQNGTSVQYPYADHYRSQQGQQNMEIGSLLCRQCWSSRARNKPSNEKTGRLGKSNAADIFRNNIDTPGLIDYGSKLTWPGTYESRMDSPYLQQAIMRRSVLNHKQGQFAPSQSSYVDLDKNPSKHLKNNNHMKRLRRRHLHGHESEVSRSSSPYSSSGTDLHQTSTYSSERDHPLPRQIRTKMHYSDETSSYEGNELYSRRDSSQTEYTVSSSCSSTEGYSSPIGSERAREMISASKSEREISSSSLDGSGSDHLEEPSYYSADSSSRKSSPVRVYRSTNSRKSMKTSGRWKKLKDKLAIVFHHHHHHHHHHHGKDSKGEERKTSLLRQRGKRFNSHYSTSKDETFGEKALEKFGKSAIAKQAGKKQQGGQFQTLAQGLMRHIQHSKKTKHNSSRQVDKGQHTDTKVNNKFHWWQLLRHHRGMNKSPAMLGAGNKKGHLKAFSKMK
nr:PREDICTED: LOW QUALITY PROTEIN: uncharacterized protein LOC107816780 [Nicotiana tabacum]